MKTTRLQRTARAAQQTSVNDCAGMAPSGWIGGIVLTLLGPLVCTAEQSLARYERSQPLMGTEVVIVGYANDEHQAERAIDAAFARMAALEKVMSDYDPESELSRLVATPLTAMPQSVSPDLWRLLETSHSIWRRTDGAFDITVGPYSRLWRRARRQKELPDSERLQAARESVGFEFVRFLPRLRSIELLRPQMRLDLGGIGKGFAADEALAVLRHHGMNRALVDCGGDIVLGDAPPGQPGWRVGIAGLDQGKARQVIQLQRAGVATSGDAFQYVEIEGVRYSHILDPRTGIGLTQRSSVTVIARDGTNADALASAISVLGAAAGIRLAQRWRGVEAQIVTLENGELRRRVTRQFPQGQLAP